MPKLGFNGVLDWLRRSVLADVSCGELLDRFARAQNAGGSNPVSCDSRAEDAFAELVRRHGPKVYGVCRRILGDHQLAEDAFQATFVVLAKRANSVRPRSAVGGFLYGVARHAAFKAYAMSRRRKETLVSRLPDRPAAVAASHEPDVLVMLDEEIANLSATYRAAVVLCEIDGMSRTQAAKQLGIAEGTLSARLARAREQIRRRLLKRGVSLSGGMLATLAECAQSAAPLGLTTAAANITTKTLSHSVSLIVHGVLQTMLLTKLKTVALVGAAMFLASSLSMGFFTARDARQAKAIAEEGVVPARPVPQKLIEEAKAGTDVHGDPLPQGALNRLGTLRQRAADSHLAVSEDGKDIITVGSAMTVRVWNAATGQLRSVKQLPDTSNDTGWYKTFLSPHGKYLLQASNYPHKEGRQLAVWDLAAGTIAYFQSLANPDEIEGAAFSADERQVAIAVSSSRTGAAKNAIRVWNLRSGEMRSVHEDTKNYKAYYFDPVVQFSPDGKKLVAIQRDNRMRCWDLGADKLAWETPCQRPLFCFSPDSKTIVYENLDPLDVATGKPKPWKVKPPERAFPLAFSPDGRQMAFLALQGGGILIWDVATGKTMFDLGTTEDGGSRMPNSLLTDFAFTPDGTGFVRRSDVIQRWHLADGKPVFPETRAWGHTGAAWKLVFSPDGKRLASKGQNDRTMLWDVATARPLFEMPGGWDQFLTFTPNGSHLLTSYWGKKRGLGLWDLVTGKIANVFEWTDNSEHMFGGGHKELRVTSDGGKILMLTWKNGRGSDVSILTIWNYETGECLRHEQVPWGPGSVLTSDGKSVLAYDRQGDVLLRGLDSDEPRWRLPVEGRTENRERIPYVCDFAVSLDERLMAAAVRIQDTKKGETIFGDIRVGDMATGRQLMKLPVEGSVVFAFSPDNRLFAVAAADGVRFWEMASQKQAGFLPAPNRNAIPRGQASASAIAFSPDSRTLATGHTDCTILLWDATFRDGASRAPLSDAERNSLWTDLAGADAVRAQSAGWRFVDDPNASVAFLTNRLASITAASADTMQQLLRDLDSDQFKKREAAEQQLRALGDRAEPGLRQALKTNLSLESTRRVETILAIIDSPPPFTNERLRAIRAVQILERIESPESRQLLSDLSQGMRPTWFKRAAAESLERKIISLIGATNPGVLGISFALKGNAANDFSQGFRPERPFLPAQAEGLGSENGETDFALKGRFGRSTRCRIALSGRNSHSSVVSQAFGLG